MDKREESAQGIQAFGKLTTRDLSRQDTVDALGRYLVHRLRKRFSHLTKEDAEDIAALTLSKITRWERPIHDLRALAHAIAIRAAYRHYQAANLSLSTPIGEDQELLDLLRAKDDEDARDLRLSLTQGLAALTPYHRTLIEQTVEGKTLMALAEELGKSKSTIHRDLQEARQKLQEFLEK